MAHIPGFPDGLYPLSAEDGAKVEAAYDVLTRLGNAFPGVGPGPTPRGWDELLDRAHQALGAILVLHTSARHWEDGGS